MTTVLLVLIAMAAVAAWITYAILRRASPSSATGSLLVAVALSGYVLIVGINTELGFPFYDVATAAIVNRLYWLAIGFIPVRWLYLYWRGRSGQRGP